MTKLLVCVDGSSYADNICINAAWVAKQLNAEINLLHVQRRESDYNNIPDAHDGSMGLDMRSALLEELSKLDEERGQLDVKKGKIILEHSEKTLKDLGVKDVNIIHRRGSLVETIQEFETDSEIIFMGKRGEHADTGSHFLGSNLEKTARSIHKPLFVVSSSIRPMKKFLIAYDGKDSSKKALEYVISSPIFKGMECHLLTVSEGGGEIDLTVQIESLIKAGFEPVIQHKQGKADEIITAYIQENEIDILATGAYSHSRIRTLLLGSTTASLIKSCNISMLLFK